MKKVRPAMKIKTKFWIFTVFSVGILCFILTQSFLSREESGALSGGIVAFLKPLLDPNGLISDEAFHHLIRKLAHFTEFAGLGFCVGGACRNLGILNVRKYVALPMLITLACAVADEFLQHFTGRGSAVTDVVIDYAGALFGMLALLCFVTVKSRILTARQKKQNI